MQGGGVWGGWGQGRRGHASWSCLPTRVRVSERTVQEHCCSIRPSFCMPGTHPPLPCHKRANNFSTLHLSLPLQEIYGLEQSGAKAEAATPEDSEERLCVICLVNDRDTTVLPCRHMCMCHECAQVGAGGRQGRGKPRVAAGRLLCFSGRERTAGRVVGVLGRPGHGGCSQVRVCSSRTAPKQGAVLAGFAALAPGPLLHARACLV